MENIEAEENAIIKKFREFGIRAVNALETQALIEMKNEYCAKKRCLDCRIGKKLIISPN